MKTMLHSIVLAGFLALSSSTAAQDAEPVHQVLFSSHGPEAACYRIPALTSAPNGDLLAVADQRIPSCGDLNTNEDINIVIRRSVDSGTTWTDAAIIVDYPSGQSASDPSFIVDRETGTVFLFFNFMDHNTSKGIYRFRVTSSSDNGQSWSEPSDITDRISKPEWHGDFMFITSGQGIQAHDGKLLHTLVHLDHGCQVFGSDDHGRTWHLFGNPARPADESKIIELSDGRWMLNSRVNGAGFRYVHVSDDEGLTWVSRADSSLPDPGCNASIIRYKPVEGPGQADMILFSNARSPDQRDNMSVSLSCDEGNTWELSKTLYPGSSAYSAMSVLKNGNIGLLYERNDYSEIVFLSFPISWLSEQQKTP